LELAMRGEQLQCDPFGLISNDKNREETKPKSSAINCTR
jgi:hypothetical protein